VSGRDPYQTLGVRPDVSDDELRSAYRRLVQLHHPDHNAGSVDAARRFEEIQEAFARVKELRKRGETPRSRQAPPRAPVDPDVESRLADLERELREAQLARERARQAARDALADSTGRPSDADLGYVTTDDSFSKIFADVRSELSARFSDGRKHPLAERLSDLIDELDPRRRR
jgi:curved DNA-binding protein CbpA